MDEITQARLISVLVVLAFVAYWVGGNLRERRRQARFAALAQSFGKEAVREGEFLSRFSVEIDGRTFDVRLQHRGRGSNSKGPGSWYVVTEVTLQGVSDLHSADIRARWRRPKIVDPRDPEFGKYFTVFEAGYPLREGWLNHEVRSAIAHFYALDLPLDPLSIEEGRLIHRALLPVKRFSREILRELLTRQGAMATALERAL
jgi:hypothetical protein